MRGCLCIIKIQMTPNTPEKQVTVEQSQEPAVAAPEAVPTTPEAQEADAVATEATEARKADSALEQKDLIKISTFLTPDGKVDMEKVKENAAGISNEVFYQIEKKQPGALLEVFATQTGDTYEFDFKGNSTAESRIGLSWFFKHLPEIRQIDVQYPEDQGGEVRKGERKGLTGSFYENGDYLEVLTGYKVTVTKKLDRDSRDLKQLLAKKEKATAKFESDKQAGLFTSLLNTLGNEKYKDVNEVYGSPEEIAHHIMEASAENDIDPSLTMSLLQAENGNDGRFFGVMAGGCKGFEMQLEMAIRTIKSSEATYEDVSGKKAEKNGVYTVEFIAFFSEIYSPSEGNPNQFNNLYKNYFKYRGSSIPDSIDDARDEGRRLANAHRNGAMDRRQVRDPVTEKERQDVLVGGVNIQKLVPGCRLSSRYGMRNHPILHIRRLHTGLDLSAPKGTPVKAWKDGDVVKAKSSGGYGKLIVVRHTDGSETYYAHLRGFNVKKGDKVDAGDQIGEVGSTGMSTGPHLHFEVRVGGQAINPLENFNK